MMTQQQILSKLGVDALSAMQTAASDAIMQSKADVIILSPTGSGKTLAYLLPVVQLVDENDSHVQAVVIVPSRELALQSEKVLLSMGCGVRGMAVYGGRPAMDEHREMKKRAPHILFATPGRLNDHIGKGNFNADLVRYLVIDEFDKCLNMGFRDEMEQAMNALPAVQRRILLSATDANEIPRFVHVESAVRLDYLDNDEADERIKEYVLRSEEKDKLNTLLQLLCALGDDSSIVFLNYRDSVQRAESFLRQSGFVTSAYHGGMDQKQREDALFKFRNGSANILISTDLASRGLDIPEVRHIIHYHLPLGEDEYVHRIGRTARWKDTGDSFFILGPEEQLPVFVPSDIEEFTLPGQLPQPLPPKMATLYIGKGKKDKLSKGDIVGFLCKKGGLKSSEIGRIDITDRFTYVAVKYDKARSVINQTKGEKIKGIKTLVEMVK